MGNIIKSRGEYEHADLENLKPNAKRIKLRKTHFETMSSCQNIGLRLGLEKFQSLGHFKSWVKK